jgi:signal transduction histidine kinase
MTVTRLPDAAASGHRRAIINFRDVTQERQDRDSLASFAGVVAHDLNNPLSIVTGWAESLAEAFTEGPVDPSDGTPMVARIQTASAHMRQFIDDLLAFTIARDHPLRIEDVDLSAIAEGIATMRREGDTRPRITVQPGMWVRADAAMMRQLFDNLIGNAAKYVGPGVRPRIEISAEPLDDTLVVSVSDNGIGVPPEMRERVFDNFQRAHTGEYAGTGIGLAICRSVVERHGGHIRVEDNPSGVGSRFVLTLPLPPDVS